jgi:hypothetical protein
VVKQKRRRNSTQIKLIIILNIEKRMQNLELRIWNLKNPQRGEIIVTRNHNTTKNP